LSGWFDVRKRLSGWKLLFDTIHKDNVLGWVLVSCRLDVTDCMWIYTSERE
jgi:hypothetical protein